jgi:hypothetical protein
MIAEDAGEYLAQPLLAVGGGPSSWQSPELLASNLANLVDALGDPGEALEPELEGTVLAMIAARARMTQPAADDPARAAAGRELGELARQALLDEALRELRAGPGPPPTDPLERRLEVVWPKLQEVRARAATEEQTLGALGDRPSVLAPRQVQTRAAFAGPGGGSTRSEHAGWVVLVQLTAYSEGLRPPMPESGR